jgi:hypothetical protein
MSFARCHTAWRARPAVALNTGSAAGYNTSRPGRAECAGVEQSGLPSVSGCSAPLVPDEAARLIA